MAPLHQGEKPSLDGPRAAPTKLTELMGAGFGSAPAKARTGRERTSG